MTEYIKKLEETSKLIPDEKLEELYPKMLKYNEEETNKIIKPFTDMIEKSKNDIIYINFKSNILKINNDEFDLNIGKALVKAISLSQHEKRLLTSYLLEEDNTKYLMAALVKELTKMKKFDLC